MLDKDFERRQNWSMHGGPANLFDRILDHIPEDRHRTFLAHADGPRDSLLFDRRIPLGFDNVHIICRCEVESSERYLVSLR